MHGLERLILVRHAMPVVRPDVPSEQWKLGSDGRTAARALSRLVTEPAYLVASDEPKSLQTIQELSGGGEVVADRRFREVTRPHRRSVDYRSLARLYVGGICHEGWLRVP